MAEYIGCRKCDSPYCKGCNLKNLETMLRKGKFDCIMNENKCINIAADVAPVVHGRWKLLRKGDWTSVFVCSVCGRRETIVESESYNSQLEIPRKYPYCHCGAKMDEHNEPKN